DQPVLERKDRLAFAEADRRRLASLAVVRVDEFQGRSRKRLALGVTEARLEGRIDALPETVEAGHRDQVGREREDAVDVALRARAPLRDRRESAGERGEQEPSAEDEPRQHSGRAANRFLRPEHVEPPAGGRERATDRGGVTEATVGGVADPQPEPGIRL